MVWINMWINRQGSSGGSRQSSSQKRKCSRKKKCGQVMGTDFIFAAIIIIFLIGTASYAWDRSLYLLRKKNEMTEMRRLGLSVSSMLVKSSGVPDDWNSSNVISVGLVGKPNILDPNKILEFNSMEESKIKDLLGLYGFDFSFRVRAINDTILFDYGTAPSGYKDVIVARRLAVYDTTIVYVEFGLWEE